MALEIRDRIKETCTGTNGDMALTGAVAGFVGFDLDATLDGDTIYYCLVDADGTKWEVGLGTLSADSTSIARTTILSTQVSFTDTTRQTFSGGTHTIFATYPASKAVYLDASGNLSHTVALTTDTSGNYVATITGGTGITSTGATSGEGIAHSLSVDASQTQITAVGTISTGTWQGTAIADSYIASASTWNAKQAALTFGIADTNAVKIDGSGSAAGEYAKFTSDGIVGEEVADVKSDLSLNNVENTAISTWAGTTNITTLGTISTGTWQGSAIADSYISSASAWNAKQAALTFGIADTNAVKIDGSGSAAGEYAKFTSSGIVGEEVADVKSDLSLNNVENTAISTWAGTTNVTTLGTISTGTWQGTAIADGYIASASTWNAKQAALTFGIADTNAVKIDGSGSAAGEYAKFTSDGIVGEEVADVKSDLSLNNVENTALSTWAGTTNITTLGTISTGTWQGTAIADSYISSASTWNAKQAALTFGIADTNAVKIDGSGSAAGEYAKFTSDGIVGEEVADVKSDLSLNNVENTALSTWAGTSNITTTGALNSGSITSGFGSIDNGTSSIACGSLDLSEGNITNVGDIDCDSVSADDPAVGLDIVFGGNTTLNKMTLTDNLADALNVTEGSNSYMKFVTTNNTESITTSKNIVQHPDMNNTALTGQSGSVVINANLGSYFTVATTGNITGLDIQNAVVGQKILIRFAWGGDHSLAFTDTVAFPGNTPPGTTASGVDVIGFVCTTASTHFDGFIVGEDLRSS